MKKQWLLKRTKNEYEKIEFLTGIDKSILKILANRGITSIPDIYRYMDPSLKNMYNPFLMTDMREGAEIIYNGIKNNEKIVIYGDYDADGITSTSILYKGISCLEGKISYYLPDREQEGYGLNIESIDKLKAEGNQILLTCDNGISSNDQVSYAKAIGFKVVVTDHHEVKETIPEADAVINPKRDGDKYPFKSLCGAGIALKFIQALYSYYKKDIDLDEYLELAAIGTICDVVDLIDENRIIVKEGLKAIKKSRNPGILALIDKSCIKGENISSYHIGFIMGPALNATGRLQHAELSVQLLLTKDFEEASALAEKLVDLNKKRKQLTEDGYNKIVKQLKDKNSNDKVIVVYDDSIHESIAGIVAGRIREEFNLPAFVITNGIESLKGSGRSIEEYNMFKEMSKCSEYLIKYGGHPMAAGFSIEEKNVNLFRDSLNRECSLKEEDIVPKLRIDNIISIESLTLDFIEKLKVLEPYGKGNEKPIFSSLNVKTRSVKFFGEEKSIIRISFASEKNGKIINGVMFNGFEEFKIRLSERFGENYVDKLIDNGIFDERLDIVYCPEINSYNGYVNIQLRIIDFRLSKKSS
ncbi:MAG: single-stranded-DNA-specific exonuclease RecJ [Bacillota bacterium]|nr:single-stranded-DNA-specific exonuclease RecJ [Bacillota bacterium]